VSGKPHPIACAMLMSVLFSSAAPAGRNANGSMIVHTDDAVNFSAGWDYCANNPLPSTCMEFTTWTYKPVEEQEAVVWVVAAFGRQSSPAVTAYQFGVYHNLPSGYFTAWGPCGSGVLEIPDATWPDESGTGTACAYGQPTYSYLFKMYWFAAVGAVDGYLSTGPYPHGTDGAVFADDSSPPILDGCYNFGTIRWGREGMNACPPDDFLGACCFADGHCEQLTSRQCEAQGGTYWGVGIPCDPNPCEPPGGACCFEDGSCQFIFQWQCETMGGQYQGDGTQCAPNPCHPTPVEKTTWGRIKAGYR